MSAHDGRPALLVVMGTSGSGKSTFGAALAHSLSIPFVDGDDLHPTANVEKMSRGEALTDQDRLPWLESIREKGIQLTHPVLRQSASLRERSSHDEPLHAEEKVREMAEVLETSKQGSHPTQAGQDSEGASRHSEDGSGEFADRRGSVARACVIACSALKRSYRDLLRGDEAKGDIHVIHIYLRVTEEELKRRMHQRKGHFMKESMLDSQLSTLQDPEGEPDTVIIQDGPLEEEVQKAKQQLQKMLHLHT
ncbi:hypothetical protein CBS101457_003257 [Exobasidium rhododendri]|nr:hypothetical protein CBS101457_003257 [Exobasidium rhododendri]